MESNSNPLTTETQSILPLVTSDTFTPAHQNQQGAGLFSVEEQLIKDTLMRASEWKNSPLEQGFIPRSTELASLDVADPNSVVISDEALLNTLFPQQQPVEIFTPKQANSIVALGKSLAVGQIQDFLNRSDYLEQFKIAFGQDVQQPAIDKVIKNWEKISSYKSSSKFPKIEVVPSNILGKADGGFDTANNKIYLSSNLIERGDLAEIVPVIIEEIGHYLDSKIHPGGDAAGDEGEIFSKLVRGIEISVPEYATLITEDDQATIILPNSQFLIEQAVTTRYAIKAEKTVNFNGSSDLDGNPVDLSDDALVYGGKGFTFNGNSILPVKYDANGNPIKDSQGKLVLVDKAVTVAAGYLQANVNGTGSKYAGLNPPQIVIAETITVPLFADIKQQELNRRIPTGTTTTTFNISTNPINTAAQWTTKFPPAGTTTQPTVVRVTGGGLNIPGTVNLSNYVIIVDSGDINFNGTGNLTNVTLVTSNGNINLNSIQSNNLSALASGTINHNSSARFGGNSLFANGTGNINFNGSTKGVTATDNLWVISAGGITFNGAQSTRGSFIATGDFIANGSTNIYGTVSSKQNVIFNGSLNFTYANILDYRDGNPPVILANLVNDSGTSNSDKITNDGRISGTVTDASQIVEFKAGFDSKPLANYVDVLPYLTNGSFSLTKPQLETIYGSTIPDGSHTLNLIATDQYGNQSSVYPYIFTLDTTIPVPTLNLTATSDTGVVGDFRTKSPLVTLTGKTEANARVLLSGNSTPVTADSAGNYTFANVALAAGNNSFTVTATDIAGNQKAYTQVVYRTSPPTGVSLGTPQILENSANNTQVGALNTIDPDGADNYVYALVDNAGGRFKLVGDKIQVANGSLLDFESNTQHQIQVRTTDGEGDSYLQTIVISVLNVNESPNNLLVLPTFILENSPNNEIVGTITSTDPDVGDSFSYSLVAGSGDGDNSKFTISGDKLVVKNSPDFETQASYTIRLRTTDAGGLTFEKQVTISVTNVNEVPTSLTLSNSTVAENSGVNGIIGTFTSTDPDVGDTRTYALTSGLGDTDNSQFTLVGDKLQLNPNPNFEAKSTYQLRVKVTDAGGLSYQQAFTVNISDVNEAPTNLAIDKSNIDENSTANSVVGNLTTTDPDAIDTANYTLITGTGDTDNSKFAISGNKLTINQSPDFETQSSYTIRIKTTDKDGLTYEKQLTIGVDNVNETPTSLTLSNDSVAENIGANGIIGTFNSTDPDLVDTRTYTLTSGLGDVDNNQFTIVDDKLQLNSNPDFEAKFSYQLRAKVTDADGLSYEQAFTVNISDVNEAPTEINLLGNTIAENSSDNSTIGILTTIDPDLGDTHTYALVNGTGSGDNSAFSIVNNQLKFQVSPNFETKSNYSLRVRTTDAGGLNIEKTLTVNITNVNEAPTQLVLDTSSVAENSPTGTLVGKFTTTDPDVGDSHTYSLVTGNGSGDNGKFSIANNELRLIISPDFETQSVYHLRVQTKDVGGLTWEQELTVNILDLVEDTEAPIVNLQLAADTGTNTSDKITNNPTITGKVTDVSGISAVKVSLNPNLTNSVNITASLQSDGTFSLDKAALTQLNGGQLPDGNYQVYLQAIDNYGNTTIPQTLAFQLLTQALAPTNLQLLASSDTGASNSDKITKNNQPAIQGNGKAGDIIQLFEGTTLLGQTTVGTNGTWQITSTTLADGTHNLTAKTIDIAGNISGDSSSLNLNIDTVIPNLQLAQQLAGVVLNGSSTLKGQVTDANITTISYQFDGANPITLPTGTQFDTPFDFTGINDGGHNLTVTATDIAGNTVARTYGVTVARGTLLTIALLNDTGISNSDGITSDINVRGQVADRTQISRLEFALDGSTNYADLTVVLQLDGTFRLLPAQLNSLAGGTLNLGTHSLNVRGVLTDGTPIATATLNFTYQSVNTSQPSLVLAKASDTGVIGDLVTSAGTVNLVAKAASGSSITLGNQTLVADVNGVATFTGINLILGGNSFTLTTTASNGEITTSNTTITRTNPDDVILTWNHIALDAIRRENTPPPGAARLLGMVHTAMYDAVNAIEQKYGVYRVDTSAAAGADEIAAAAQAAAKVLLAIYPNQQAYINAALESSLLDGATAAAQAAGIAVGNTVAANILAWRQQDGARNPASYNPSTEVGKWQPDLPNYDGALLPQWGKVTTFGLTSGSQFRPTGAPDLTSAEYTTAFNETKTYGSRDNSLRTADNTQSALFWADGNGTYTPPGHWNDIASTAASLAGKSVLDNARVFAQLNVALADAGIAAWDAKYTYNTWRPITAIRQADKDGNPLTSADPNWVPLINTPPFPEYVSGHSTFSGAASAVLTNAFGTNFSFNSGSTGLPDTTRSFASFEAAALEAGQSRIYGGIHFQFANRDGLTLGNQIGNYVTTNLMVDNSLSPIQVSLTRDTAAFDTTNRDRITNSAGITGKVTLTQPNLKLQVGIAGGTFVDVTSSLDASGNFQLDAAKLTTIVGTLTDKAYQLTFKLVDVNGTVVGSNNLSFILDTTAAQATLNPLTGTVTPTVHVTGTATDGNGGSSGRFKVDGGNWTNFSVQPNGTFDQVVNPQGLTVGVHQVAVEIADLAGNVTAQSVSFTVDNGSNISTSPGTNPGWGRVFGNGFSLAEGNSLVTQASLDVALGGSGKRTLDFDLNTSFDKSDVKSFGKDRVAVYLVDSNNQLIALDATHPGGVPLFSLSETGSEIIPGLVKFDGTHVQIDVSNVAATSGKLVVQLLNQDGDSGSNVTITNFVDAIDPNGTRGASVSPAITPVAPGAAKILDSYMATNNAQLLLSNVSLDKATGKYTADLRVQNVGTTTLSQNLAVLLTNLPTGVTVANSSGTHPAGSAYLNFDTAIAPGGLAGGAISDAVRVVINDPNLTAFSFKPVVLQGAAAPLPDLSGLSTLTVKVGDKIDIPLQGELAIKAGSKLPTGAITGDSHLVFTPAPDQVGSYTFTLIARNGGAEVTQDITLNVVADPITTTRVTGTIATIDQAGLAGVLVELSGYQATTDSSGKFTIVLPESSAGDTLKIYGQRIQGGGITYPFIAEKMGLLLGHDIYRGVNNQIDRPIYLPTIDVTTGTTVNPAVSTVVSNPKLVGAQVSVAANSLFDKSGNAFVGIMSITEVPTSLTPAALPDNLFPDLVITVQPGDMVFNTPARISLPNRNNLAAGAELDLWSINPNTGEFDKVGKGRVSADRSVIETIDGGIRNSSWHFFALPPFLFDALGNAYNPKQGSPTCPTGMPINSEVILQTGAVVETHNLTTYESLGVTRGISLSYNSLRADARPIIHFNYDNVNPNLIGENLGAVKLVAKLKVTGDNGFSYQVPGYAGGRNLKGGENFWSIPAGGGRVDAALQADLRNQDSGLYEYTLDSGILGFGPGGNFFGSTSATKGKVLIVNSVDSAFGSGWSLNGLQSIVTNKDGSILLIDGDGHELLFDAPLQPGGKYINPTGEFSTLERLGDGTYRRTLKDGTVYQFNTDRQLANMSDRQGNSTQYRYDASGNLTQTIDPTGLTTNFNYTGNRITSIVDPAGRTTKMEYDANGNLIKLTDPDGTYRRWEYDADHHMTAAIDKVGGRGEDFYDFAGRAYKGIRPDGSVVQINPIEVQGLYRPDLTNNPNTAPIATALAAKPTATYLDGNGNPLVNNIDKFGQATAAKDGVGKLSTTERNSNNLVTTTTSATGGKIDYTYDERGNVIGMKDLLSSSGDALSFDGINDYVQLNGSLTVGELPASTWEGWLKFDALAGNQTIYSETSADGTVYKLEQVDSKLRWAIGKEGVSGQWQFVEVPLQQASNPIMELLALETIFKLRLLKIIIVELLMLP